MKAVEANLLRFLRRGYRGGGDILVGLTSEYDLDYVMDLVGQAYLAQAEVGADAVL